MRRRIRMTDVAYRLAALVISIAIIMANRSAGDGVFVALLWPYAKATEIFFNLPMFFVSGIGYTANHAAFVIGPSCLGVYFFVMLFLMLCVVFVDRFFGIYKAVWLAASCIGSAVVSLIVSCIRIIGSVPFVTHHKFATMHTAFGAALYFGALIACYVVLNKLLRRKKDEEAG